MINKSPKSETMASKIKKESGLLLRDALGEMSTLVRFKALQMRIDAVPPMVWPKPLLKAIAGPLSEYEQAQRILEMSTLWEASSQRAELAQELSRLVALAPPPKEGDRAELVLPLWGYHEDYAFPDRFDPQRRSQGGVLRSGPALNDVPLEDGVYLNASRGHFQGRDGASPGEFGDWFKHGRVMSTISTQSRERIKNSLSSMVKKAIKKTMGGKAWDLISKWENEKDFVGNKIGKARIEKNEEVLSSLLSEVSWGWSIDEDGNNKGISGEKDSLITLEDTEVLMRAIGGNDASNEKMKQHQLRAQNDRLQQGVSQDEKPGWLMRLFENKAPGVSAWNTNEADFLKRRGREIFEINVIQRGFMTRGETGMVLMGLWLGNEMKKDDKLALMISASRHFALRKNIVEDATNIIADRRKQIEAKSHTKKTQHEPLNKADAVLQKKLMDKAQGQAKRVADDLVEDAMCMADSRMGHWAASLGFESIGAELAAGSWDKLNNRDWGKEAATRRFARDATVSGRLWAALEAASGAAGEDAKREARLALSTLGMGTQEVEEFSQKPQAQAFLICAQLWAQVLAEYEAENNAIKHKGNSKEDGPSEWDKIEKEKKHHVCTLAALMRAFYADAKENGGGTLSIFSDPEKAGACIKALRADSVWARAVAWVDAHQHSFNDLAEAVDWDMSRALAAAQAHEEAAGKHLKNVVAVAAGVSRWSSEGAPKFSKLWNPMEGSLRMGEDVQKLLGQEGFAGLVAKIAAWEGWCPEELQGDTRTQTNAWLGIGKEYALSKLGVSEASWKWLRSQATPVEQMMSIKQMGAGAHALAREGNGGASFFGRDVSRNPSYRSVKDGTLSDRPMAGFEGFQDKDAAKELSQSEGPSDNAKSFAVKRLKELETWLDDEAAKSLRIGASKKNNFYQELMRKKIMKEMMSDDMGSFHTGASKKEVDKAAVETPMGMLMTRAIKSGKPMAHAIAAANFMESFWPHAGSWGDMRESYWRNVFSPAFNGAKLSSVYEVLSVETQARTQKMDMFLSAILEQAGSPKSINNLEKLGEFSDWAYSQAGRFWQELPETFGWKTLERGSDDWHTQSAIMKAGSNKTWRPMGLNILEESTGLEVVELCNTRALVDEGCAMSHCVGSYSLSCEIGERRIFSVRKNGKRLATLELSPEGTTGLRIAQLKGQCNMDPSPEVKEFAARALVQGKEILLMKAATQIIKAEEETPMRWELDGFDAQSALASSRANRAAQRDKGTTSTVKSNTPQVNM